MGLFQATLKNSLIEPEAVVDGESICSDNVLVQSTACTYREVSVSEPIVVIGASLSEPHTRVTALHTCSGSPHTSVTALRTCSGSPHTSVTALRMCVYVCMSAARGGWNVSRVDHHVVKFTTHRCSSPYQLLKHDKSSRQRHL